MWHINLGNILFKTPDRNEKNKKAILSNDLPFDMYERFSFKIEKVSVEYHWLNSNSRKIKILKEIELSLDIGV
jgi:hypothetical protein